MILNKAGMSATTRRQSTAGTSDVVDNGGKFATGVVDTDGNSSVHHIVAINGNNMILLIT
jgi:hypothetical protein